MKKHFVAALTLTATLALPMMGLAQSLSHTARPGSAAPTKMAASAVYICPICHHKADAALAKRIHYICPVDGGKLVAIKPAKATK